MATKNKAEFYKNIVYKQLREKVAEFSLLEKGACNNIFLLKTESGKSYCLKEERPDKLDGEANNILTEADLIDLLHKKSVAYTPKILFVFKKHKVYCYEYIDGETLDSRWEYMTKKDRETIMKDIGKYHAELYNKISVEELSPLGIKKDVRDFDNYISDILCKLGEINKSSELYKATLKMQQSYSKARFDNAINSFLHGDLHKGNLLVNKNKLAGVVDFGKSVIGDIHKDFSHHMRHYPEYIDIVIKSFENMTGINLSKNKIVFYAFLKDLEKLIYHLDKYKTHKEMLEKKIKTYNKLLS